MKLNVIRDNPKATHAKKRVGRGIGSGTGKTSAKGHKGQKARSGVAIKGFEGGQMPLHRRLPKRGFKNPFRQEFDVVNLGRIQSICEEKKVKDGAVLDKKALVGYGLLRNEDRLLKLLGKGAEKFKSKVTISVDSASASAVEAVKKNGGEVKILASEKNATATKTEEKKTKSSKKDA